MTTSTTIRSIALEADDVAAAENFYAALGVADRVHVRAGQASTSGFRGYALSVVVAKPSTVDAFMRAAVDAGAAVLKPAKKGFWGYGGTVQAPDGAIWKFATSSKRDTGEPPGLVYDDLVLLLGVDDVKATRQFYVGQGLDVTKSFGSKYVELEVPEQGVKLALYSRRAAAKDAVVSPEGTGSHRIAVLGDAGPFTDPDGFVWEATPGAGAGADRR